MRIAALDLGSNSFHMIVVETRPDGSFAPLIREREMLRLGDLVARDRVIGRQATDAAIAVVSRFKAIAEANGAEEIIALGTSAIREALDGGLLVDRVRVETGVKIVVVDGTREAELIFRAIRSSVLIDPGPALAADLGGGSLELSVGDRSELAFATSVHLGVGRLTAELVANDPPSDKDLKRLRGRIAGTIAPVLDEILALRAPPADRLVGDLRRARRHGRGGHATASSTRWSTSSPWDAPSSTRSATASTPCRRPSAPSSPAPNRAASISCRRGWPSSSTS